ncbi:MAG: HD domain-containing protein [Eubacterium sp.]
MEELFLEMIKYYDGDPKRIQHFTKVHSYARLIGILEGLSGIELEILEIAAIVHDIGIKPAEEKFGNCSGRLQEQEGPPVAKKLLSSLNFSAPIINRVCFLIANHHTYNNINGLDYQILVEADFLVNMYEDSLPKDTITKTYNSIFKTQTGCIICKNMFNI